MSKSHSISVGVGPKRVSALVQTPYRFAHRLAVRINPRPSRRINPGRWISATTPRAGSSAHGGAGVAAQVQLVDVQIIDVQQHAAASAGGQLGKNSPSPISSSGQARQAGHSPPAGAGPAHPAPAARAGRRAPGILRCGAAARIIHHLAVRWLNDRCSDTAASRTARTSVVSARRCSASSGSTAPDHARHCRLSG